MKFSEITKEQWDELSPYLDTCLLPVTGMTGKEKPYEATEWLERLRDMMDLIEIPFKGRVVTYPACHYLSEGADFQERLNEWASALKQTGFRYVIVISPLQGFVLNASAVDLLFVPNEDGSVLSQLEVSDTIRALWSGQNT